jgi:iron complex transport system substrate-binding protein
MNSRFQIPDSKGCSLTTGILHSPFSILLILFLFQISCSDPPLTPSPPLPLRDEQVQPARIVSLAPSITEVLFKLNLGDRVAGVTRYCDYPPEATEKPVVGGYFDVNYEMLLSLEADLVILLTEHQDALDRLEELGVRTLTVNHSRVDGILESITTIANRSGVEETGKSLRSSLEGRMSEIRERKLPGSLTPRHSDTPILRYPDQDRPRVLVAVGRLMDKSSGGEIFISGRDGFYDDLVALAGGVNAYREETLKFPAISDEGLVRLDPDIILEMVPDLTDESDRKSLMDLWRSKRGIRAVRKGQVYILGDDYVVVPGPRFVDLLEDMAEIINSHRN